MGERVTMNVVIKSIRKLMGWCPNAGVMEARKAVQFDELMVSVSGSAGEPTRTTPGWWNKYRNRI
ncbi:MAG: DUF1673 family protein, partial [Methanosarcina sp.]|nr:DUF1673 family protein [Methanosarcina sp.]